MVLKDKTAVVTGGSRGIGEAIVRAFVSQGAKVVFTYLHSEEKANQLVEELGTNRVQAIQSDGIHAESVIQTVRKATEFLGYIDILVNNAGIISDSILLRMSESAWDEVIDTNLKSVFLYSKEIGKRMVKKGGSIINVSSVMGIHGNAGQSNYAASKAGIIGFSKSIAIEYGSRNIRCNVIAPGWIRTQMTAEISEIIQNQYEKSVSLRRIGTPEEVADVAVFLASSMSSYITGAVIEVSGGLRI